MTPLTAEQLKKLAATTCPVRMPLVQIVEWCDELCRDRSLDHLPLRAREDVVKHLLMQSAAKFASRGYSIDDVARAVAVSEVAELKRNVRGISQQVEILLSVALVRVDELICASRARWLSPAQQTADLDLCTAIVTSVGETLITMTWLPDWCLNELKTEYGRVSAMLSDFLSDRIG